VNADTARQTGASILLGLILASALIAGGHVELPSGLVHPARGFSDSYQVLTVPSGLSKLFASNEREDKLSQAPVAGAGPTAGPVTQEPGWMLDSRDRHGRRAIDASPVPSGTRPSDRLRASESAKAPKAPASGADTTNPRDRNPSDGPLEGRQPREPGRSDVSVTPGAGVRGDGAVAQRGKKAVARGDSAAPRRASAAFATTSHPTGKLGVARKPVAANKHKSSAGQGRNGDSARARSAKAARSPIRVSRPVYRKQSQPGK
jgi:hypothetical protein